MPCGPNSICTPIFRRPSSLENVASCSCKMEYIGRPPNCRLKLIPVLCKLSDWSKWSTCSQTCGKGKKTRRRTVITEASNGGRQCEKGRMQDRPCEILPCPVAVNCKLSNWNKWSTCSKTCGEGKQTRRRTVIPEASGRCRCGRQCRNGRVEDRPCGILPCPVLVDCELSNWNKWSTCSKSCGEGKEIRRRTVITEASNGGRQCEKGRMQDRPCEILPCPVAVNCKLSNWNKWSTCSKTCGEGKQTRRRTVIPEASGRCRCGRQCRNGRVEDRPCEILPCHPECQLSEWSNWSTCRCSKASGTGKQTRWKTDISNCWHVNRNFEDRQCNKFPCTQSCIEKHNQFLCWNTVFDLQGVLKEKKEECAKLCYSHSTCEGWSFNGHTIQYNKVGPLNLGTSIEMLLHPSMKSSSLFCLSHLCSL